MEYYVPIPVGGLSQDEQIATHRINCLGSLYYFIKVGLRRNKLTEHLHLPMCFHFESDYLKELFEWPRDHFKTTIVPEGLNMWSTLPFLAKDEDAFLKLGYSDKFVSFLKRKHDPTKRNLVVSENIENAGKIGARIDGHFKSNALFITMFPEIQPTTSCTWNIKSMTIRNPFTGLPAAGPQGEGTYDFIGVGGALQSRHYNGKIIQDDLVGRKAIQSQAVMDWTTGYHSLVAGAFEDEDPNHEADEIVIGNRWGWYDLNSHIRENEPWFRASTHSAEGGCCRYHPPGRPILPEIFSMEKLLKLKKRFGTYVYSCQYLNNPSAPEDADFQESWLRFFTLVEHDNGTWDIVHEIHDGEVNKDITNVRERLNIFMITDPNHAGNSSQGRARHAIVVWGVSASGNVYLLEEWAKACGYTAYFDKLYEIAKRWRQHKIGFETIAGQRYAAHHLSYLNEDKGWKLKIIELKGEVESPDGTLTRNKYWRIQSQLAPLAEYGNLWVQRKHQDFLNEWKRFSQHGNSLRDLLDASAYLGQMMKRPTNWATHQALLAQNQQRARLVNQPYSTVIQ